MEHNISAMLSAYRGIDKISSHPVPWPYTHLTQTFNLFWVYTLPLCIVQIYGKSKQPLCRHGSDHVIQPHSRTQIRWQLQFGSSRYRFVLCIESLLIGVSYEHPHYSMHRGTPLNWRDSNVCGPLSTGILVRFFNVVPSLCCSAAQAISASS